MHRIDHFAITTRHIYEGAARLREETGLDSYDSGWFPGMGLGQRTVPLGTDLQGRHCYIEIMSVIDHDMAIGHFYGHWYEAVLADAGREDRLMGWSIAVDTVDELQAAAERLGYPMATAGDTTSGAPPGGGDELAWIRWLPDGRLGDGGTKTVPDDQHHAWPRGLPNFLLWSVEEDNHPDTDPAADTVNHRVEPRGISWVELGDEALTREWLGAGGDQMDIRYVDGPAGLYAVGIKTDEGEIVVRRPPVPLSMSVHYRP